KMLVKPLAELFKPPLRSRVKGVGVLDDVGRPEHSHGAGNAGLPQAGAEAEVSPERDLCVTPHEAPPRVDPPGIEPGSPACRAGVVPLDYEPDDNGPPGIRTPIPASRRRCRPVGPAARISGDGGDRTLTACLQGKLAPQRTC